MTKEFSKDKVQTSGKQDEVFGGSAGMRKSASGERVVGD
jgi:hypothetical protein